MNGKHKGTLNVPSSELPVKETDEEILASGNIQWQILRVLSEFIEGFDFLSNYEKSVTIFGSTRFNEGDKYYEMAREMGSKIANLGYAVVSGGGPGIMEAANRGAKEACDEFKKHPKNGDDPPGKSLGLNIQLPREQRINPYVEDSRAFRFFFSRKVMLSFAAETYIYFPGGIGTLDELFEILQLIQTKKIMRVPIILMGSEFWKPYDEFMMKSLYNEFGTIDNEDLDMYHITDDMDEAIEIIKKAPIRKFSSTQISN